MNQLVWRLALACLVAAMAAGAWFGYSAWHLGSQRLAMLSVALLLCAPLPALVAIRARPSVAGEDASMAIGAFVAALHRIDGSLRVVRLCRSHIGVVSSYVFVLWVCQLSGYVRLMDFLVFYTVACGLAAAVYLPWLAACELRLYEDRAEFRRQMAEVRRPAG